MKDQEKITITGPIAENYRGVSAATLKRMGVARGTAYFEKLNRRTDAIIFQYVDENGEVVNLKARSGPSEEKAFTGLSADKHGAQSILYNLQNALKATEVLFIVEGELDAVSLIDAGLADHEVASVPAGGTEGNSTLTFLYDAIELGLRQVKKFVICTDNDAVGKSLRRQLAEAVGLARAWFVEWPEGIKDASDFLQSAGHQALLDYVTASENQHPWPIDGVYRLSDLPEDPPFTLWEPGFPEWENKLRLGPRTFSVFTGHPGHGKTLFSEQIWFNIARRHNVKVAIASFENRPKPHHRRYLRQFFHRRLEKDLSERELRLADEWIEEHFLWIVPPRTKSSDLTFGRVLDLGAAAVTRFGAQVLQIDPWNRMEYRMDRGERVTDYVSRCLDLATEFADSMNAHIQILAHPAKRDAGKNGPPTLEDIADSKAWDSKCDFGFVMHRKNFFSNGQRQTDCEFLVRKVKYEEFGYPTSYGLRLDLKTGCYVSTDYETIADRV